MSEPVASTEPAEVDVGALARTIRQRLELCRSHGWSPQLKSGAPMSAAEENADGAPTPHADAPAQRPSLERPPRPARPARPPQADDSSSTSAATFDRSTATLQDLQAAAATCEACRLSRGRTRSVFGVGSPTARLFFVGEGPGYHEDQQGEPFVGAAGELLDRMIVAMGYRRDEVYIANVVKCRPPGNRNPEGDEIAACLGFLERQLELVSPDVIVALGAVAARTLLKTTGSLRSLRGRFHDFDGRPVAVTYHPAYLLRNPEDKRAAWGDLQLVMKALGG